MKQTTKDKGGFTIVELLVAVAVFTILMSAIGALFAASIFTVRSGYTNIKANEEVRGLVGLLERDLHTAFISRDYGDTYKFYGTPVGMTFVGLARGYSIYENYVSGGSALNLGRVTYVVQQLPAQQAITVRRYTDEVGDTLEEGVRTEDGVLTYAVIRYYEPGVRDLDTFPVVWENGRYVEIGPDGNPVEARLATELEDIRALRGLGFSAQVVEAALRAKKRQIWIRLLSTPPHLAGGFPTLWEELNKNPHDHVLAQNIVLNPWDNLPVLRPDDHAYDGPMLFEYGLSRPNRYLVRPFWNADHNFPGDLPFTYSVVEHSATDLTTTDPWQWGVFNPLEPMFQYPSEPFTLTPAELIDRGYSVNTPAYQRASRANRLWLRLWSPELGRLTEEWEPLIAEVGNPVHPRMPELVVLKAGLLFEAASPGRPDVQRPVDVVMNIPSGYMRSRPG